MRAAVGDGPTAERREGEGFDHGEMGWIVVHRARGESRVRVPLPSGWVHRGDLHVNHSLKVVMEVFDGFGEDGCPQLRFVLWPEEGVALTADRLFAAAISSGVKAGSRCLASVVVNESGALGVELTWPEPGRWMPVTRDTFARLLSDPNLLSN
jgi:hypothetical protein